MKSIIRVKPARRFYGPYKHGRRWRIIEVNTKTRKRRRFVFDNIDAAMKAILAAKLAADLAEPPTLGKAVGTTRNRRPSQVG